MKLWDTVNDKIKIDDVVSTKVINITDNHINVIINDMFDGFISLNELSWIKKPPHPSKIVSLNDNVDVKILEIDSEKKRLVCSLKQMRENPWKKLKDSYNVNDSFETEIVNVVDFGIFVKVQDEIDGMVHVSDLSWDEKECQEMLKNFKKGEKIKVKILDINSDKERISLGIKHLQEIQYKTLLRKIL